MTEYEYEYCQTCNGSGEGSGYQICPVCKGTGEIVVTKNVKDEEEENA